MGFYSSGVIGYSFFDHRIPESLEALQRLKPGSWNIGFQTPGLPLEKPFLPLPFRPAAS